MKTFSFVKWQLKKWLPLFAVLSVLVFGVVMIQASSSQMTYESQIYETAKEKVKKGIR